MVRKTKLRGGEAGDIRPNKLGRRTLWTQQLQFLLNWVPRRSTGTICRRARLVLSATSTDLCSSTLPQARARRARLRIASHTSSNKATCPHFRFLQSRSHARRHAKWCSDLKNCWAQTSRSKSQPSRIMRSDSRCCKRMVTGSAINSRNSSSTIKPKRIKYCWRQCARSERTKGFGSRSTLVRRSNNGRKIA